MNIASRFIKNLKATGYKSIAEEISIDFAIPNGKPGSGLTFIVGANNSGKTNILECIRACTIQKYEVKDNVEFFNIETHQRNKRPTNGFSNNLLFQLELNDGGIIKVALPSNIDEEAEITYINAKKFKEIYFIYDERGFKPLSQGSRKYSREEYQNVLHSDAALNRPFFNDNFLRRLAKIMTDEKKMEILNLYIKYLFGITYEWAVQINNSFQSLNIFEQSVSRYSETKTSYNSGNLGKGINCVLPILEAFIPDENYPIFTIIIDEPEKGLDPSVQKKLLQLFKEVSKEIQIVVITHSIHFIDFEAYLNGAIIQRIYKEAELTNLNPILKKYTDEKILKLAFPFYTIEGPTKVGRLRSFEDLNASLSAFKKKSALENIITKDRGNLHILGLDAKATLFLDNKVILVEGQDDAYFYPKIAEQLGKKFNGEFFGWGAGGKDNIYYISQMLHDLGFTKVCCILDKPKKSGEAVYKKLLEQLQEFPSYKIITIPAYDVRDKDDSLQAGLLNKNKNLKDCYRLEMLNIIEEINRYMDLPELHLAVLVQDTARIHNLIKMGVSINQRDQAGDTPLHLATRNGSKDIITDLLKQGADLSIENNLDRTPLHEVAILDITIVRILLNRELPTKIIRALNTKDNYQMSPSEIALKENNLPVHTLLLEIEKWAKKCTSKQKSMRIGEESLKIDDNYNVTSGERRF